MELVQRVLSADKAKAALARLDRLGGQAQEQVFGVELDPHVHATASQELAKQYRINVDHLLNSDFFDVEVGQLPAFDAVEGRPSTVPLSRKPLRGPRRR